MSVTRCYIKPAGPRSATIRPDGQSTYQVTYEIETDNRLQNPRSVIIGAHASSPDPLPALGTFYFEDPSAVCISVGPCTQDSEEATRWTCSVTFGQTNVNPQEPDEPDPLQRPIKYWLETMEVVKPVEADKDGTPLRNSAGFEFIDPVMIEETYPVLVAQKNVTNLQTIIDQMIEYNGTVNSSDFKKGKPRTVRFMPLQASQPKYENNVEYYEVQYRFAFNAKTWDVKVVDQGFEDGSGNRILDANGEKRVEPTLLDGSGNATTPPGTVLNFRVRDEKDLNKVLQ